MKKIQRNTLIIAGVGITIIVSVIMTWLFQGMPSLKDLADNLSIPSIRIVDRHGRVLYEIIDKNRGRHTPVPLESIPEDLIQATIATEDRSFYTNPGIDFKGILRALIINLRGNETIAGGSTITQQVVRNLLLSENEQFERTIRRKLREGWLSWQLTNNFSKDEILELYLNQMYYGGLAYGVEAAAQTYFGKSASELDLAESALIAGIPQGPAIYNPLVDPQVAINRQHIVLGMMYNYGAITTEEYNLALRQPLVFTSSPFPIEAPHFVMMVIAETDQMLPQLIYDHMKAITIQTTLDLDLQNLAEGVIIKHLTALRDTKPNLSTGGTDQGHSVPGGHNVNNAALVALNSTSGEILTMVGSPDYFDIENEGAINMAVSPRQPGSALKPLIYAAAFNPSRNNPFTPATMILDVQTSFTTHKGNAYSPANYDNLEHGLVSARQALASSLNIPAVKILDYIGLSDLFDIVSKLGVSSFGNPDDYDLSLALGGGEITLLDLTTAYSVFANQGIKVLPYSIQNISTLDGQIIYRHEDQVHAQVIDERVAWLISDILNDNDARSIGFGTNSALNIDRPAAVKTGTTTNYHDNWTIGYTPDIIVGVWVGNASHEPMRSVTGLSGAGPIWHQFIREALTGTPEHWFTKPDGITQIEVCALSGLLPTANCPYTKFEWFIAGTEPTMRDNLYQVVEIDKETGRLSNDNTPQTQRRTITALNLPPEAHSWARKNGLILLLDLQNQEEQNTIIGEYHPIQILSPANSVVYRINPTMDKETQKLHIEVANSIEFNKVELWLNDYLLTTLYQKPYGSWWSLSPGKYAVLARGFLDNGESIQSPIVYFTVTEGDES